MGLADKGAKEVPKKRGKMEKKGLSSQKNAPRDKNQIETHVDNIYYDVLNKKKVHLKDVADKFKVHKKKAEEWASVLDEQDLIDLHYPAVGHAELRAKTGENTKVRKPISKTKKIILFTVLSVVVVALVVFLVIWLVYLRG